MRIKNINKWLLASVLFIAVITLLVLYFIDRQEGINDLWMTNDIDAAAAILVLFIQDNNRMPINEAELYDKYYLNKHSDGYLYPGNITIGRNVGYGLAVFDRPFHYWNDIIIGYNMKWQDILFNVKNKTYCEYAKRYDSILSSVLQEKTIKTSTTVVPGKNVSSTTKSSE
jgi:hypothetical protein